MICPAHQSLSGNPSPRELALLSLTLVVMLSHPALFQACISVYTAVCVVCTYFFLDKCIHLQLLPEDKV